MRLVYGDLDLTDSPFLVEFGLDTGAPQNESVALPSLLQDGDVERSSRAGNRTMQFAVVIEGSDLLGAAEAEALLIAESEKVLNTISVDPDDGFGPIAVYQVFRGQVTLQRDDNMESQRLRRYSVTVRALPYPRSATETVTAALPATGTTTTLVNNGSATTNWTGFVSAVSTAPSPVSGAVKVTNGVAVQGAVTCSLVYTAAITTSATKYLVVDWKPESNAGSPTIKATADGVSLTKLAESASPTAGFTRTWFGPVAASSIASVRFDSVSNIPANFGLGQPAATRSLYIDNVDRTDVTPTLGTGRQLLRRIAVGGSAPTPGSVAIEHASSSLGDVLALFYPDAPDVQGYSPAMMQYVTSAGTSDSALVSGSRKSLIGTPAIFRPPPNRLVTGKHLMLARIGGATGTGTLGINLSWTFITVINGTQVGPTLSGAKTLTLAASTYAIFTLDRVNLPTCDLDPSATGYVQMTVSATAVGLTTAAWLDEVWLMNTDIGQFLQVSCGSGAAASGGPANRLFLEPATPARPRDTVRIGFASDRSDSFYPDTFPAWQFPEFTPPAVNVFTVTTNALDASVTLRGFNRWHTNPAD